MRGAYTRALLKLSGEALAGERGYGLDYKVVDGFAEELLRVHARGEKCFGIWSIFGSNLSTCSSMVITSKFSVHRQSRSCGGRAKLFDKLWVALSVCAVWQCVWLREVNRYFVGRQLHTTFVYVTLRAWRANEGGTTDLPDYSETVHETERCLKTKLRIYTSPRNGTYILLADGIFEVLTCPFYTQSL